MLELKKEQNDKFLGRQQWWDVGFGHEALVSLDIDICSIHVTNKKKEDVTKAIGDDLNKKLEKNYKITVGIDSCFVEVPEKDLSSVLKQISNAINQ